MKLVPFGRASFMMDFVSIALVAVLPTLTWSIILARRGRYHLHKRVQVAMGLILLAAVLAFEVEVRLYGWQDAARSSPYYETWLFPLLYFHLFFAVSTTFLWTYTLGSALRRMPGIPIPSRAGNHKPVAWVAALFMYTTALTGWTFYYAAFIAD